MTKRLLTFFLLLPFLLIGEVYESRLEREAARGKSLQFEGVNTTGSELIIHVYNPNRELIDTLHLPPHGKAETKTLERPARGSYSFISEGAAHSRPGYIQIFVNGKTLGTVHLIGVPPSASYNFY